MSGEKLNTKLEEETKNVPNVLKLSF